MRFEKARFHIDEGSQPPFNQGLERYVQKPIDFGLVSRNTPLTVTLMHRNHPVITVGTDPFDGQFTKFIEMHEADHLPGPAKCAWESGKVNDPAVMYKTVAALNQWRVMRLIPNVRAREYKKYMHFTSPGALSFTAHMANISDAYWITSSAEDLTYDMVSFQRCLFRSYFDKVWDNLSPDFSTNGNLPKYWDIREGKRLLFKLASWVDGAEPYNEAFASELAKILGLPYVPYSVKTRKNREGASLVYSVCEAFTSDLVEYVPAWEILCAAKKSNSESEYDFFLRCGKLLGLPDFRQDIDNLLAFDSLINNEDRHYGNFGFLRNAETLEWLGLAPIFDSGSSLWYDSEDFDITPRNAHAKPFRLAHDRQLRLTHPSIDLGRLKAGEIETLLARHLGGAVSEERLQRISFCVNARVKALAAWQEMKR